METVRENIGTSAWPADRDEMAWVKHLDALGVAHSGIKDGHILTVRDPDNIQHELFASP